MQSPLAEYYPRELEGELYLTRSHGVQSLGFGATKNFSLLFGIDSPFTKNGRFYETVFPVLDAPIEDAELSYRGQLGEEISRVVIKEFFRRQSTRLGIHKWDFVKWNKRDVQSTRPFRTGSDVELWNHGKYNVIARRGTSNVAEYDGIVQYTSFRKRGVVVVESKTAGIRDLNPEGERGRHHLQERIIKPLQDAYPQHTLDLLLMAPKNTLFNGKFSERKLIPTITHLKTYLGQHGIGLVPMTFPVSANQLRRKAQDQARTNELIKETGLQFVEHGFGQHWVQLPKNRIALVKGRRVETILERAQNSYRILFERSGPGADEE